MSTAWNWPDWGACSDPPAESCSDAGCPVHGDHGDDDANYVHHTRDPEGDESAHA
jgi:hypothetical protein